MKEPLTSLLDLPKGRSAIVQSLPMADSSLATELMESGFLPGQRVFCEEHSVALQKKIVKVGSIRLALRFQDSKNILVQREETETVPHSVREIS